MKRFWKRDKSSDLEDELRRSRPSPRAEFLQALTEDVRGARPRRALIPSRAALAGAMTVAMLAVVGSLGGLGYASQAIKSAASSSNASSNNSSAASKNYKFTLCHHPPGNPGNAQTITVGSQAAVNAHLRNHPGDHLGPCTPAEEKAAKK